MGNFESSRGVIVGINGYGNGVPVLRSAVNDAQELAKILEAVHGYAVTLLVDREATLTGLKHHFEDELPQQVGANDRVLVYFAGHGIAEEGDDGPTGYLLPQDASEERASWLRMETFREWLGKLRCRHLLVVLDCCCAGAFRWTKQTRHIRAPLEVIHRERYERFIRNPARQVIASAAYDQLALDTNVAGKVLGRRQPASDNTPNSPFARALFDGLKGDADLVPKNGDGVIVGYELATFLQDFVSRCADDARHEQMPCIWSLGKEDSGQFVFLLPNFDPDTLKPAPVLDAESNPYRGLSAYEEKHAGLFFGRDQVVEDLAAVVKKQPLTMVLGASGTGKSSLVKAGLLSYPRKITAASGVADPEAASDAMLFGKDAAAEGVFRRLLMRPADAPTTPLRGLIMRLSKGGAEAPGAASSESATDETPAVAAAAFSAWFAADPQRHLFLVIDQFEELVTLCTTDVRTAFLQFLADLLDRERERLRVVLTLRSDFEPQFTDSALQRHLQAGVGTSEARFLVPPLQHYEFREIIEKPASERVLFFEPPALVDRLITEVIQMPGALPLLSFALSELYLKYVSRQTAAQQKGEIIDRAITEEDYRQLGGVVGALSKRATEEYDACDETHRRTMQRVMLRMVATEGELARRRVPRDELIYPSAEEAERASAVVERLEKARLVVSGRTDGSGHGDAGGEYVEPAHDALVRAWAKLLEWQREAATDLPVHRRLTEAVNEWVRRKRDSGLLWTADPRLALVRQQLTASDSWLNARETEFVEASTRRKRRNTRLRSAAIAGLGLLTVASVAGAVVAVQRQRVAVRNQQLAVSNESRALTALSDTAFKNGRYNDAVKLALTAWPRSAADTRPMLHATAESLGQTFLAPLQVFAPLRHEAAVVGAVFYRDESRILTCSYDKTARLWDAATGRPVGEPMRHQGVVSGAVFNRDESRILTSSSDNTARLWDAATGRPLGEPMRHEDGVSGAVFNRDESRILTLSSDKTARLWDAATGRPLGEPMRPQWGIQGAVFNRDETRILTWGGYGYAQLWDAATGEPLGEPMRHEREALLEGAVFNRDESRILTWSWDNTARLWDAATGKPLGEPMRHEKSVSGAVFNRDESRILTRSSDGTARLWDAATGKPLGEPMRHEESVLEAFFNRDETRILTWSGDGTARLWDAATGKPLGEPMRHEDGVSGAVFNRDESRILTWSLDNMARQWDAATGHPVGVPMQHGGAGAVFSRDETRILTWSGDGTARLWDAATGKPLGEPMRHERPVSGAVFNRDETRILTWSDDKTARLWDVGRPVGEPMRHEKPVRGAVFSRDESRILTSSYDGTARLWDAATGRPLGEPMRHEDGVSGAVFNRDGSRILTWSYDKTVRLWDAATGKPLGEPMRHEKSVSGAVFNRDGSRILTWSYDKTVRLWDVLTGQPIGVRMQHEREVSGAVFNRDESRILTSSSDNTARLWDAATGKPFGEPMRHEGVVSGAVFSRDESRILTWSDDKTARLWDAATGKPFGEPMRHEGWVKGAVFDRDESRILTWSEDGTAKLWEVPTGQPLGEPMRHEENVWGAVFNRDEGRILTWSYDGTARLWDAATSKPLGEPMRHEGGVWGAVFSRDESRILTWSQDGTARLWDALTGQLLGEPMRHAGVVAGAVLNQDESRILTWSEDGTAKLWEVPTGHLFQLACRRSQDHDLSTIAQRYGIQIKDPICVEDPPAPDPALLE